jgi:hypothetical protein
MTYSLRKRWEPGVPWSLEWRHESTGKPPRGAPALQLQLGSLGPEPGTRWRNRHTGELATVLGVGQRRSCWVLLRYRGERTEVRLDVFLDAWTAV